MSRSKFIVCPEPRLCVQVFYHDRPIAFPEHVHSEMAIVICTGGVIESNQFSCRELLQEDHVLFTNSGIRHSSAYCVDGRPSQGVTLEFQPAVLERLGYPNSSAYFRSLFLGKLYMPAVGKLARMIADTAVKTDRHSLFIVTALARQIVFLVLREWPKTLIRDHEAKITRLLPRHELVSSIEIMNVTHARDFSVHMLARKINRSSSSFSRLFMRSMSDSPHSFFRSLLLQQAADLLSITDRPVKDIALTLGFSSVSHFSSSFRQRREASPTEFRRQKDAWIWGQL